MQGMKRIERKKAAVRKELESLRRQEQRMAKKAVQEKADGVAKRLEEKIPERIYHTLEKAFCKAFGLIFEKGTQIIEKSYQKETLQEGYAVQNFSAEVRGTRREMRRMKKSADLAGLGNLAMTTVEGVGLGVLGIGLPDIVLFTGVLLKGVYETALRYGFDYDTPEERLFILKLLQGSVSAGEDWERLNGEIDGQITREVGQEELQAQTEQTAAAFASDMLLLKFIQGLPLVGVVGGLGNPVYYSRVMKYVGLKYRKRYLLGLEKRLCAEGEEGGAGKP